MFYKEKVKVIRRSRHLSQRKLAELIGKSPRAVWGWEKGEHSPSISEIREIAKALNVKTEDISSYKGIKSVETYITDIKNDYKIDIDKTNDDHGYIISMKNDLIRMSGELKRLKEENLRYKLQINRQQSFMYFKDNRLRFTEANSSFKNNFNISDDELKGKSNYTVFGIEGNEIEELERQVIDSEVRLVNKKIHIPGTFKKRDGMLSIFPVTDEDGKIKGLACNIVDVTALSKAHANMSVLENVINSFNFVVWIKYLKPVPYFIFVSNAAYEVFGRSPDEFYNNPDLKFQILHSGDKLKVIDPDNINGNFSENQCFRIILPDGSIRKVIEKIYFKKNVDGVPIIFGITRIYGKS